MLVFGIHAVEESLKRGSLKGTLYLSRKTPRTEKLKSLAESERIRVIYVHDKELKRICSSNRHRGAALRIDQALDQALGEKTVSLRTQLGRIGQEQALILLLDGITDPQNFGSILRSADQFRIDLVIIPSRRSARRERETETVLRTSAGASAYVPVVTVTNLVRAIKLCKDEDFWVYGAHIEGNPLNSFNLQGRIALLMGSEGKGIRRLVSEHCDSLIRIPSSGHVDSFNVSVAAGILMYEVRRQQGFKYRQ